MSAPINDRHTVFSTLLRDMLTRHGRVDAMVVWNHASWSSDDEDDEDELLKLFKDYGAPEEIHFLRS